jgi:hypothetical protein
VAAGEGARTQRLLQQDMMTAQHDNVSRLHAHTPHQQSEQDAVRSPAKKHTTTL